jgi:hypothetical protein
MPLDGGLRRLPDGRFDILVREDAATTRQRFSIAHELGHVIFYRCAPKAKAMQAQRSQHAPEEEERLCNVIAEELLMPLATVTEYLALPTCAEAAIALAKSCQVSIEAAAVRLTPLWPERGELQFWRRDDVWRPTLVRRTGRFVGSLETFGVDEWGGERVPPAAVFATTHTSLFSRSKRMRVFARTTVVPVSRRALLIGHTLIRSIPRNRTELELLAHDRVCRAQQTRARSDCTMCGGVGTIYPDPQNYPANRREAPRLCDCRYDRPAALSA